MPQGKDLAYLQMKSIAAAVLLRHRLNPVLELVSQLEALNLVPPLVELPQFLDDNWIHLYTAFSELLPLLALNSILFVKVENISQSIDSSSLTIVNSTTLSNPFATFSFSASASFEPRSPIRIQVEFKEGTLKPPEIIPKVSLPKNVDVFGQTISLSPVQQSLGPLEEVVANIQKQVKGWGAFDSDTTITMRSEERARIDREEEDKRVFSSALKTVQVAHLDVMRECVREGDIEGAVPHIRFLHLDYGVEESGYRTLFQDLLKGVLSQKEGFEDSWHVTQQKLLSIYEEALSSNCRDLVQMIQESFQSSPTTKKPSAHGGRNPLPELSYFWRKQWRRLWERTKSQG